MLSQTKIDRNTPLGANVVPAGGATFRVWAPRATAVYLHGTFAGNVFSTQDETCLMARDAEGFWSAFQPHAKDGDAYRFWITGTGSSGYKRDPYARELTPPDFPDSSSILRDPGAYPWHDAAFQTPAFNDLIVYQIHIGTFAISRPGITANFLDIVRRLPYLEALGINMLQPLPVDEQEANPNMGYNGADLFSPDFPYACTDPILLSGYLASINQLLNRKMQPALALSDITPPSAQLKVLVDLCHLHGIAFAFDVVFNHAGGFGVNGKLDDNCLYYMDRVHNAGNQNDSLYFTDQDRGTGGLAFALWNQPVKQLLLDNARALITEFHADGFRYDEISTLLSCGQGSAWDFCRQLTTQNRALHPRLLQNAEFWPGSQPGIPDSQAPIVQAAAEGGAGFDVLQADALRSAIRGAIAQAASLGEAPVSMSGIAAALYPPHLDHAWRAVTCIENHDLVYAGRAPRIPALADGSNARSWYARSRTRVAMAILLTAPGIPQLFMGQEFLEDKPWSEDAGGPDLLWWNGLGFAPNQGLDPAMGDHLRFTQDLIRLRWQYPALRGERVNPFLAADDDRILGYHRWLEGSGQDVVVFASLANETRWEYRVGFPFAGPWEEVFNSDVYDHWVNPQVAGNGGGVEASASALDGLPASAGIVLPANGVVVFVRKAAGSQGA